MADRQNTKGQWEQTPLGKILHVLGAGERLGTNTILRPLAGQVFGPEAKARMDALGGDVYGGDIVNAVSPPKQFASPLERLGRSVGGALLGGAVDPLSYIGVGHLTRAGKAAKAGASAIGMADKLSDQARLGQRSLATVRGRAIVPSAVSEQVFKAGEAIQAGHVAETTLAKVGMPELGAFWDRLVTSTAQRFNFNIGADPAFQRDLKEMFSRITGTGKLTADKTLSELEPMFEDMAHRFAARTGRPVEEMYQGVKDIVFEVQDAIPEIELAREGKFIHGSKRTPYDISRNAIIKNIGLPAAMGGPAAPTDNELIRGVRDIVLQRKHAMSNMLAHEEEVLGRELRSVTDPDAGYQAGMISNEARKVIEGEKFKAMVDTVIGGKDRKSGHRPPPTEKIVNHITSRMRILNERSVQELAQSGALDPITIFTKKGAKKRINPFKMLQANIGTPITRRNLKLVERLVTDDKINWDQAGELAPRIPVSQRNQYIYENGWGKWIPKGTVKNFFDVDPTAIDAARGMRSDRLTLSREWFDTVKGRDDLVGLTGHPNTPDTWVDVKGIPELKGYSMNPDEARFMARMYRADVNPQGPLKEFMELWKQANTSFKAWTLSIFPSYQTRNGVGLMWNYYLGSDNQFDAGRNMVLSADAWKHIKGQKAHKWKLKGVVNPETGKDWTADQIWRRTAEENGWGVGFVSAENPKDIQRHIAYTKRWGVDDPESTLMRTAKDQWKYAASRMLPNSKQPYVGPPPPKIAERIKFGLLGDHPWVEAGFRIGSYMDDRVRMAHIIQRLKQGDKIEEAIRSSKKHFFDYSQLTPQERAIRDYGLPFYSWSRKNIPYQLEMLVRRPDRIARFNGALQGWEGTTETPDDEKFLNSWMKKNFAVRMRTRKDGVNEYFAFKNWLPLVDIAELFHMQDWAVQSLTPFARVPLEQIANQNFHTDRKIDHMNSILAGERTRFGGGLGMDKGVAVPNRVAHVVKSVRLFNTMHQLIDNPQELDVVSKLMRLVAGRTYPLDVGRSKYQLKKEFDTLERDSKKAIASAAYRGDKEQVSRLVETFLKKRDKKLKSRGFK